MTVNATAERAAQYAARDEADRVRPGDRLTNGATVVAAQYLGSSWVILALWGRQYVTWKAEDPTNPHGTTAAGHYFGGAGMPPLGRALELSRAVDDYCHRAGLVAGEVAA